ncbi:MAG: DoxX family protein [Phycisphaeraceae bacterium]
MKALAMLIGRLCLAAIFAVAAAEVIQQWPTQVRQVTMRTDVTEAVGHVLLGGAMAFLILGVTALVLGLMTRWGAALLMFFLIPATVLFCDFWNYVGEARVEPMMHFYKNLGLFGGLALLLGRGAGPWGFDRLRERHRQQQAAETARQQVAERAR